MNFVSLTHEMDLLTAIFAASNIMESFVLAASWNLSHMFTLETCAVHSIKNSPALYSFGSVRT